MVVGVEGAGRDLLPDPHAQPEPAGFFTWPQLVRHKQSWRDERLVLTIVGAAFEEGGVEFDLGPEVLR